MVYTYRSNCNKDVYMHEQITKEFGKMNICMSMFGVPIGWRKYLYECMPFGYVNLCLGQVQKKWGVLSVMLFIMISAYKSMYGQDRTLIHRLSANKSEYFDIYLFMSAMDSFLGIALLSRHYTEDMAWHQKTLLQVLLECDISKTIHSRHGKVYIKTFRNFRSLQMCECHSSTLDIGGVVAWNQQCSMTSQKDFFLNLPCTEGISHWA